MKRMTPFALLVFLFLFTTQITFAQRITTTINSPQELCQVEGICAPEGGDPVGEALVQIQTYHEESLSLEFVQQEPILANISPEVWYGELTEEYLSTKTPHQRCMDRMVQMCQNYYWSDTATAFGTAFTIGVGCFALTSGSGSVACAGGAIFVNWLGVQSARQRLAGCYLERQEQCDQAYPR
jgi:hypothetical protein